MDCASCGKGKKIINDLYSNKNIYYQYNNLNIFIISDINNKTAVLFLLSGL